MERLEKYRNATIEPRARSYRINGETYQRVTTALGVINKPALGPWMVNQAVERMQTILLDPAVSNELVNVAHTVGEAGGDYEQWVHRVAESVKAAPGKERDDRAEAGTVIHQEIAAYLASDTVSLSPKAARAARFLLDWTITVEATEFVVWHEEQKIAGTIDGVGRLPDGTLIVWDWKTGSGPWWEMALQLGAYGWLLNATCGVSPARAFIVKLADDCYSVHEVPNLDDAAVAYRVAMVLHRAGKSDWFKTP